MAFTADPEKIGHSTALSISTDSGTTFLPVGAITGFTPNKITVADVDGNTFGATTFNGLPVEQTIPGWVTPGEYGFKLFYGKTAYAALHAIVGVPATQFKVVKSDGAGYVLTGYIKELGEEIPLKEGMTCEFTVKISGAVPTFNATQS